MNANAITIAIVALGAYVLLTRKQAPTAKQTAINTGAQTYNTPTAVAAALGAFVAAATRPGAVPAVRSENVVGTDWKPYAGKAVYNFGADPLPALGVYSWAGNFGDTDAAWRPSTSYVSNAAGASSSSPVDGAPSGSVYTLEDDFVINPFVNPSYNFGGG